LLDAPAALVFLEAKADSAFVRVELQPGKLWITREDRRTTNDYWCATNSAKRMPLSAR